MFLSKAERDFLVANKQATHDYYCVKSRLQKKLRQFTTQELPLLIEKGYIDLAEYRKVAENCNVSIALVAQPGRAKEKTITIPTTNNIENESPRWASIPQPKVSVPHNMKSEGLRNLRSARLSY